MNYWGIIWFISLLEADVMDVVKKIFNKKFIFFYSFLILLAIFYYYYRQRDQIEILYALIYIFMGLLISLFYILKDFIYTPDKLSYQNVIMEDALFHHRGEIIDDFESYPLYTEFVTFHLKRASEDPYSDTVQSLEAVRYIKNKMVDSLFIPLNPKDPLLKPYALPLNEAIGKFLIYARNTPIIIYNQPFTHTYLNVKLDKEVHISFIDAMTMSRDLYGISNKPLRQVRKHLGFYRLDEDPVGNAKVVGAIYLDYIYTITTFKNKENKKAERAKKRTLDNKKVDQEFLERKKHIEAKEAAIKQENIQP